MPETAPSTPIRRAPHEIWREVRESARSDAFGGALLLGATLLALVLANSGSGRRTSAWARPWRS
ncbi:MAG TPA: hypothetical protein H9805_10300, partial [Candidatus Janibacter merdipullorum]|nr:hypothetical protein [Candidatus Janibacter merdipullorum]